MRLILIENEAIELPPDLLEVVDSMPAMIDREAGARLITEHLFPVSRKTLKSWALPWSCPNGKAIAAPAMYLAYALLKARKASAGNARWHRAAAQTASAA